MLGKQVAPADILLLGIITLLQYLSYLLNLIIIIIK